jgi:hypothetical protein
MKFARLLLLAAAAAAQTPPTGVAVQVPPTVVRISNLDGQQHTLTYQNAGLKPIRAVVLRDARGQVTWQLFSEPLAAGLTSSMPVWPDLDPVRLGDEVHVAAVVFSDGTHVGSATDSDGVSVISKLFDQWRGEADATSAWKGVFEKFPSDDRGFLQAFYAKTDALTVSREAYSDYQLGVLPVDAGMKAMAERIRGDLARGYHRSNGPNDPMNSVHDAATAHQFLVTWVNGRVPHSQSKAPDAGEAVLP